jgi:conjugative transfer signal peptidase TraF
MAKRPAKAPALPMLDWMAEQARKRTLRSRILRRRFAWGGVALGLFIGSIFIPPAPLFVWNASPSAPVGLYLIGSPFNLRPGQMVALWFAPELRKLAAERRYLPANIPAIKRVVAVAGDDVCAEDSRITVNGNWIADRQRVDGKGRAMPWWEGCKLLAQGQIFVLNEEAANSFDGRYVGIIRVRDVIGKARLIWQS